VINNNNKFLDPFDESLIFCDNLFPSYFCLLYCSTFPSTILVALISEQIDNKLYSLLVCGGMGIRNG